MTRDQAVKILGGATKLQEFLGLKSHSSIYNWGPDEHIPQRWELQIRLYQLQIKSKNANRHRKGDRAKA